MKSSGFEGAVDIRPRRIDSSYDPTIGAWCRGDKSEEKDGCRVPLEGGVLGVELNAVVIDLRG
jgi:hypothetical protein